ncbi:6,7-dimethyl-8-ribityllumazine synthase [Corynebacterium aquilae]|uniref:6,7-dimethyl-8-ribityllumazine synthase n=1 Tax=Corynebacterium aquilae DSM 44791 TaxID=1431546 RepID=A0A1L7CG54_9CORY|nr:6,7-dimethyl-8-ribityllumazine synthase [Corynebacterium aquilae]APT84819.1 6,7-dimethyl-8-ribityllumazine synthase [Corynebacterium aquilae DSM 44791]
MSGAGLPAVETVDAQGLTVGIVTALWNADICDRLHQHAIDAAQQCGASVIETRVVGALELSVVAQKLATHCDAVVANGCVIKGGTPHFDYVCDSVTQALTRIALDTGVPVGNGVLTCNTHEQAVARSGAPGAAEDKGREATLAALHTAVTLRQLDQQL